MVLKLSGCSPGKYIDFFLLKRDGALCVAGGEKAPVVQIKGTATGTAFSSVTVGYAWQAAEFNRTEHDGGGSIGFNFMRFPGLPIFQAG
jgi:hypothetical protein